MEMFQLKEFDIIQEVRGSVVHNSREPMTRCTVPTAVTDAVLRSERSDGMCYVLRASPPLSESLLEIRASILHHRLASLCVPDPVLEWKQHGIKTGWSLSGTHCWMFLGFRKIAPKRIRKLEFSLNSC